MSQYIVSARKYRPESFDALIGQDNIVRTLKNSIKRGKLAHAYLFCGPRGVGKTTTARIFAKMINCSNPGEDMEPCGQCESCVSFSEGRSYCIHEMDAASNNGVDDIKALMEKVVVPPQVGKYSVYIIDEVHMLTSAAFNAFLKTLEEPPSHAIFILATTEKHKVLPTILSRCQTFDFNRISVRDAVANLREIAKKEGVTIDDESLHVIAVKADGAMRDALTIFDQTVAFCGTDVKYADVIRNLNVLDYEYEFSLVENFLSGDYIAALKTFDEILSKGFDALHFVSSMSSHLRNLAVAAVAGTDALLDLPESICVRYREQASRCPVPFLYEALGVTTSCESQYKAAINPRLHIEYALMKLCFISPRGAAAKPVQSSGPVQAAAPVAAQPAPAPKPAPASNPAPAPEPAPKAEIPASPAAAETPAPRRRRTSSSSANKLSINALMASEEVAAPASDAAGQDAGIPSQEAVLEAWKKMPPFYEDRPRVANAISSSSVVFSEENGYLVLQFFVSNVAQKQWIVEKLLHELEGRLRKAVPSPRIRIRVDVEPDTGNDKRVPYLPEEKAKDLMSRNNEVKLLVTDLELDIK